MPSLLDLPDEHLVIIGSFLNPETYLPLPSWKPFWNNSRSPLKRKATRHLRAFLATCRRIRGVVRFGGQFREIKGSMDMMRWVSEADEEMKRAITRLHIDCNPLLVRGSVMNGAGERAFAKSWSMFWSLLQQLPNLAELSITRLPDCAHHDWKRPDRRMRCLMGSPDLKVKLPKIKSLSLNLKCHGYRTEHGPAILGPMTGLGALQLRLTSQGDLETDIDDEDEAEDDINADGYSPYLSRWRKHNESGDIPIRKLSLLIISPDDSDFTGEEILYLEGISGAFPNLIDLDCTSVDSECFSFDDWSWPFAEADDGGEVLYPHRPESQASRTLRALSMLTRLEVLDIPLNPTYLGMRIECANYAVMPYLPVELGPRGYEKLEKEMAVEFETRAMHQRARASAMQIIMEYLPSLKRGWLWERRETRRSDVHARWGWTVNRLPTGESEAKLDNYEVLLPEEFVNARL